MSDNDNWAGGTFGKAEYSELPDLPPPRWYANLEATEFLRNGDELCIEIKGRVVRVLLNGALIGRGELPPRGGDHMLG